jgi:hypothetical protein
MRAIAVDKGMIGPALDCLAAQISGTPLYRSLYQRAIEDYFLREMMFPQEGDGYSVGKGVFFYLDQKNVLSESGSIIVVSSIETLTHGEKIVDTRLPGYDASARAQLDLERGAGNYSGWDLWKKILEQDTISNIPGKNGGICVFTRRACVPKSDVIFEIDILPGVCDPAYRDLIKFRV